MKLALISSRSLDSVRLRLDRDQISNVEARILMIQSSADIDRSTIRSDLTEIKESSGELQRSVEQSKQIQKDSTAALGKSSEDISCQLNMLERCQNHYFPTLISFTKSLNGIVTSSNRRALDIAICQRRWFPRLFSAIQTTLVRLDDLAALGAQLLSV